MATPRSDPHYLAFDLGASSCRAILGRFDGRRMHMEEVHRFETPLVAEGDRLFWDLEHIWNELKGAFLRTSAEVPLRSLSTDSWGVDYVPLDESMQPVRRAHCYRDPRVAGMEEVLDSQVPPETVYAATGIQAQPINTLFQVLADRALTPEEFARTQSRLLIADYFNYRFSGMAAVEASAASTTQLFDPVAMTWAHDLIERLDLRPEHWPITVPSATRLGDTQLSGTGVSVVAGCSHDTACAVAAVPAEERQGTWAFLSSGTWSILGAEIRNSVVNPVAQTLGFSHEVGFDGTVRLLKNMTGLWVLQECERTWRGAGDTFDYEVLMAEAAQSKEPPALINLSDPEFASPGDMPARLRRFCQSQGMPVPEDRGTLVRLILESLAGKYLEVLRELESLTGQSVAVLHVIGGGSRNRLLNQWTADRCQCPVEAGPAEATALGNLLVQAHAMGDIADTAGVRRIAAQSADVETFFPASGAQ